MLNAKRNRQAGFSLLEVLVAFAILTLCLGVLLRIFGGGDRLSGLLDEHARAVVLAESLLADAGVETPLQPGAFSGNLGQGFSWIMRVTPFTPPGEPLPEQPFKSYWVELTVAWGDGGQPHSFTLGTLRLAGANPQTGFPPR